MLEKAICFAVRAHEGTVRKGSGQPYIFHPIEAAMIVSNMSKEMEVIIAALLHDTIEDTSVTYEQIELEFGKRVAEYVKEESEDKTKTWKERKKTTIQKLPTLCVESKMIALGDKLSNLRSLKRDYRQLGEQLWDRFHEKRRSPYAWYYSGLLEGLSELAGYPEYQEFQILFRDVFERGTE